MQIKFGQRFNAIKRMVWVLTICTFMPFISFGTNYVSITQPFNDTLLCVGSQFNVNYLTDTVETGSTFTVQLSDALGSFASPLILGTYSMPHPSGTIQCTIPTSISLGTGYRIRIVQTNPYFISPNNGKDIRISAYPIINSITSNSPVCEGTTLTINASANPAGALYSWTGPNSFVSTMQNPAITNPDTNAKGKYYLTVTKYGCSRTDSITAVVIPTPTKPIIVGPNQVCVGSQLALTAFSTAGVNFEWTGPNGFKAGWGSINISNVPASAGGVYTVKAYATGCSATESIAITMKPRPDSAAASNNGPVCEHDTLKLFASCPTANVTYTWRGPNGFSSTQQNPVIPNASFAADGTYIVNSILNGCLSVDGPTTASIGVPLIPPTVTSNGPSLCPGDSLRLIATATVNIGIFQWTGPNNFSYIGKSPVINPVSSANEGTYSVTLSHNGCTSAPGTVFIKIPFVPKPIPSTNSPVCEGGELKLMCESLPSDAFKWLGPNNFISHSKDTTILNITKLQSGDYTIYNIKDNCSNSTIIGVEVNPLPNITRVSSNTPVCEGSPLKLSATSDVAGSSFVWRGPAGYTASGQNPEYPALSGGTGAYYVRANAKGCLSQEDSTIVDVKEKPILPKASSNSPVKEGETLKLYSSSETQNVTFKWTGPNGFTSSEQNPVIPDISTLETGSYIISAATPFGCISSSVTIVVVQAGNKGIFVLSPNPNKGIFTLKGRVNADQTIPFEIVSISGAVVYRNEIQTIKKIVKQEITLPLELPTGEYFLRMKVDGVLYTNRFTIAN